ncbi:hypothetical protein P153DRAFT_360706 [Dothidotthia symphoricarpi CBS 119687]|uniref:LIM zinc-binding domain-containing protein n=1 Tax=Dothidotthia symphoricarpi CBS 119687 TaxID=1392245 RepID=A0A6A6A0N5_9PLEO|nr:uncharacterized protein P153DRAFT_360706 [Dothidotthia symphoricarpi CBS 119687]KAF2125096.1 hypothetical protein P153DRAFT_360706 [Dothidotthia symphoricarpi CBS 119687]
MDPLSVTASIIGILAAAGKLYELLDSIISTTKDAPQVLTALARETHEVEAVVLSLQNVLKDLSVTPPHRTALIQLDQLIITLTDSVLAVDELKDAIAPFIAVGGQKIPFKVRLKWTRAEASCMRIVDRMQMQKTSILLMLNILQCSSDLEASQSQASLALTMEQLVQTNRELCRRLRNLEDRFDATSVVTEKFRGSNTLLQGDDETIRAVQPSTSKHVSILEAVKIHFAFDDDLQSSRVYQMTRSSVCDHSFVSSAVRTNAWSIFSGLSLADISIISVVALPLYSGDINNHEHYSFGDIERSQSRETTAVQKIWSNSPPLIEMQNPLLSSPSDQLITAGTSEQAQQFGERDISVEPQQTSIIVSPLPSALPSTEHAISSFRDEIELALSHSDWFHGNTPRRNDTPISAIVTDRRSKDSGSDHSSLGKTSSHRVDDNLEEDDSLEEDDVVYDCRGCGEVLKEGKAFELAGHRYHMNCFRCNTCGTLLDSDANLLLLGDGSLMCNNCTYSCNHCGNKIEDLAILTGDQAFCVNCFICRNCKRKIANLRYARTSQGIFCMTCHESFMARRRKKTKKPPVPAAPKEEKSLPALADQPPQHTTLTPNIGIRSDIYLEPTTTNGVGRG